MKRGTNTGNGIDDGEFQKQSSRKEEEKKEDDIVNLALVRVSLFLSPFSFVLCFPLQWRTSTLTKYMRPPLSSFFFFNDGCRQVPEEIYYMDLFQFIGSGGASISRCRQPFAPASDDSH